MQAADAPVKYAGRSYLIEFSVALALYVGIILARPWLLSQAGNPMLIFALKIAPSLPVWLMLAAVWRHYLRIDELDRLKMLQTLAISFGFGSCLIVTYSFLEDAGLPALAITWAWPTLAACWVVTHAIMSINSALDRR